MAILFGEANCSKRALKPPRRWFGAVVQPRFKLVAIMAVFEMSMDAATLEA
jgi:hypothetical protein